jgi:hypothetical protein
MAPAEIVSDALQRKGYAAGGLAIEAPTARDICAQRKRGGGRPDVSYGVDPEDLYRRAANYIDKILKGTKPPDVPVEQASKYLLVVNLKTAKAPGLSIPPTVLARADEVIE